LADSTRTTDENGVVIFSSRSRTSGEFTTTVTDVSRAGWEYDAAANEQTSGTITVPE
jgi:hypothetical protein